MTRLLLALLPLTSALALATEPPPVEVTTLHYEPRAKEVRASGPIAPVAEQSLSFKVPGLVREIPVEAGQVVAAGTLIATLDLEEMDAQLARATSLEADARRQVERLQTLHTRQLASDEQLRVAETALQVAEADRRIARFNRRHAEIRAPADGRILAKSGEANQWVQPGEAIVQFADTTRGWVVKLQVADIDVVRLQPGDPALIRLDAYPGDLLQGRVRTLAGKAVPRALTFGVEVLLDQPPPLYAGLIAHATLLPQRTTPLAALPLTALVHANGYDGELFVLDANHTARREQVRIAWIAGDDVLIYPGLAHGSRVVTHGGSLLYSGAAVRPLP